MRPVDVALWGDLEPTCSPPTVWAGPGTAATLGISESWEVLGCSGSHITAVIVHVGDQRKSPVVVVVRGTAWASVLQARDSTGSMPIRMGPRGLTQED